MPLNKETKPNQSMHSCEGKLNIEVLKLVKRKSANFVKSRTRRAFRGIVGVEKKKEERMK